MKTIQILEIANGENITRLPQVTVRADGTLWVNKNTSPLVTPSATLDKPSLLALLEAKAYDKIPAENYLRINQTVNGRECLDQVDADARRAARLTPAQKAEIETAKQNARRARNYDRLQNEGEEGYNPYRAAADDDDRTPYHKGDNQAD